MPKGWVKVRKVYAKRQTDVILRPPTPLPLSVKISVKISMLLGIRETCMPLKASMLLLPHPLNVTLTLSVHFSNFDLPLSYTIFIVTSENIKVFHDVEYFNGH